MFRALRLFFKDFSTLPKFYSISKLVMRISVFIYVLLIYGRRIKEFSWTSEYSILALTYIFFSFLLLIAGFLKRSTLTRFAAAILALITIVYLVTGILLSRINGPVLASTIIFLSVLLYFTTSSCRYDMYKRHKDSKMDSSDEELEIKPPLSMLE